MKGTAEAQALNIILITIDSLRYDHLGCYGYHRGTSPNIDALADRGAKFLRAISNGGETSKAFPPILASALPPLRRVEGKAILRRSTTLAEVLKRAGYHTAAFHSNPWLSRFYNYDKGFDVFDDGLRRLSPSKLRILIRTMAGSRGGLRARAVDKAASLMRPILARVPVQPIISAEGITKKSISWVRSSEEEIFLWIHYMDVHHPYKPPDKYVSQFCDQSVNRRRMEMLWKKMIEEPDALSQPEIETLIDLYDAEIKYTDGTIGSMLDELSDYLSHAILIVTADHGDELGEHGRFGHHSVYDEALHVPLIISGPGIKGGTVVEQQVSLIDLPPTILDIARTNRPPSFHGKSLLPLMRGRQEERAGTVSTITNARFGEMSIAYRVPGWKYIYTESLDGSRCVREEVYDLTNDPGEKRNLHGADIEQASEFELEAKEKLAQFRQLKLRESSDYEKQRVRARLSKLSKPQLQEPPQNPL